MFWIAEDHQEGIHGITPVTFQLSAQPQSATLSTEVIRKRAWTLDVSKRSTTCNKSHTQWPQSYKYLISKQKPGIVESTYLGEQHSLLVIFYSISFHVIRTLGMESLEQSFQGLLDLVLSLDAKRERMRFKLQILSGIFATYAFCGKCIWEKKLKSRLKWVLNNPELTTSDRSQKMNWET